MKQVITEIINIEHNAKEIIQSTNEEIANKKREVEEKLEKLHVQLRKDSDEKIEFLRERDLSDKNEDVDDHFEMHFRVMEDRSKQKLEEWSQHLYEKVIGEDYAKNN